MSYLFGFHNKLPSFKIHFVSLNMEGDFILGLNSTFFVSQSGSRDRGFGVIIGHAHFREDISSHKQISNSVPPFVDNAKNIGFCNWELLLHFVAMITLIA